MILSTASGRRWHLQDAARKLSARARLPGARVFDLAAESLRQALGLGLGPEERLSLALPASWLVNSPAVSPVLRRWALPPQRETWLALLEVLEDGEDGDGGARQVAMKRAVRALGSEPYLVEAVSKIAALLAPDSVPLMPSPARACVLGEAPMSDEDAFVAMVAWLERETATNRAELEELATAHVEVPLSAAQVLDRLLWFDSEGYRHFAKDGFTAPTVVP